MKTPTHEEISKEAQRLWQSQGCPIGHDTEIWLKAERTLIEETTEERTGEEHTSSAQPDQKSIAAAAQKDRARAPQVAKHTGPKSAPAQTGKPLWSRPHSS